MASPRFPSISDDLERTIEFTCGCCVAYNHQPGFTHMKLQKLLYYMQGFHLAKVELPLFSEPVEAWEHGPVIREVWHVFKDSGADDLPVSKYAMENPFDKKYFDSFQTALMSWVYQARGSLSAAELRRRTHKEIPWRNTYRPGYGREIPLRRLQRFFSTQQS